MPSVSPRILVVDDDPDMRVFLATVLTEGGFDPVVAADAGEGLEMAARLKPALILLEARLPRQQGSDVYRELKQDPALSCIPVIMLSLLPRKTVLHYRKLEAGREGARLPEPEAFLGKPPEAEELMQLVERLTDVCRAQLADSAEPKDAE